MVGLSHCEISIIISVIIMMFARREINLGEAGMSAISISYIL